MNKPTLAYRYGLVEPGRVDREAAGRMVIDVLEWAASLIGSDTP